MYIAYKCACSFIVITDIFAISMLALTQSTARLVQVQITLCISLAKMRIAFNGENNDTRQQLDIIIGRFDRIEVLTCTLCNDNN